MNEALEQAAEKALVELIDVFVATKDFTVAQAPEVVAQLLKWEFAWSLVLFGTGIAILITTKLVASNARKRMDADEDQNQYGTALPPKCLMTGSIWVCGVALSSLFVEFMWLKIWLAPKVWLIEYAANLVK